MVVFVLSVDLNSSSLSVVLVPQLDLVFFNWVIAFPDDTNHSFTYNTVFN